jgi:AcrR family transcriptional regulator
MLKAQQARSRATEERILAATETLLADLPFDELAVAGIASMAGVSVGGFYARFEGKNALLEALHSRYEDRRTARLEDAFALDRWIDRVTRERFRGVIAEIVDLMAEERHVLRTFLLRYWSTPEDASGAFADRLAGLYDAAAHILLLDRDLMRADDPEEATRAAIAVVMGACRDSLVMKPDSVPGHPRLSRDAFIDYLTAAALGVVGLHEPGVTT